MNPRRTGLVGLLLAASVPGQARAHEVAGRFEAPLPVALLFGGAAMTVAATALLLAVTVEEEASQPSVDGGAAVVPRRVGAGLRVAGRATFFGAFVFAVAAGLFGKQAGAENVATLFVWPVWLKGVAIAAALFGSPWAVLSPWKALYDGVTRLEGEAVAVLSEYPPRLGEWPALVGFLVWIGVLENLTTAPRSPRLTAVVLVGYALAMLAGGLAFGPTWFRRADALAVLYRLFGRVAPLPVERTDAGGYRLRPRPPWAGCLRPLAGFGAAAFVVAAVYTVSFDGFTSTPEYQAVLFGVRDVVGTGGASLGLYLLGFAGFVVAFVGVVALAQRFAHAPVAEWPAATVAFAPTVLPIAVAYEVAHNYPFALTNAGQLPAALWAFLGLGHAPVVAPLAWLPVGAFWWSQVVLVVVGHVVAVVAAHHVALAHYRTGTAARRAHVPLAVLMVGYTVLSLWIVSRPIVA